MSGEGRVSYSKDCGGFVVGYPKRGEGSRSREEDVRK